jgi:peptidoglycan/LPS O-acetylase OafA/YrhL
LTPQRPTWLPKFVPELDGLRGLAVLGVIFCHCHPRFEGTPLHYASLWGWAGVNLFFVLSGFLITSILLESREKPRYFRNFYGRRALRIWPVYVLVLGIVYAQSDWFIGPKPWDAIKAAPWFAYVFFVQNLFHLALPPAIGPTWSLAIEQQYYLLWAPGVRFLRRPWMLASVLAAALVCSPLLRHLNLAWIGLNHTLIKLDGIAIGSLLALGLHTLTLSRRTWLWIGLGAFVLGIAASATVAGGTSMLDSALATAFAVAGVDRRPQPNQCHAAPRSAGLLWPHQLWPLHDSHYGLHLPGLLRRPHERLWNTRQHGCRRHAPGSLHHGGRRALVRLRVANPQAEAIFLK